MNRCLKSVLVLTLIGLVLTACDTLPSEESPTPIPSDTPSPTETIQPTATNGLSRLTTRCVETIDASLDTVQLSGSLFTISIDEGNKTYLWDLSRNQKIEVNAGTTHVVLSPDHARLAAIDRRMEALVILDSSGTRLLEIPDWEDEYDIIQWLKDNQLVIKLPYGDSTYKPDAIMVFDIATKDRQEIYPEFPLITDFFQDLSWGGYSISPLVPNPQLTHLVYPSSEEAGNSLILWDLQTEQEVGRIHHHGSPGTGVNASAPAWSQDGTAFVTSAMLRYVFDPKNDSNPLRPLQSAADETENVYINVDDEHPYVSGFELIRVNQSGEAQRLSYLTTTFTASQEDWVWSPDETRIAFWLTIEDDSYPVHKSLSVLDVASGEVTNYCISGYRTPIWSPDGRQIAINQNIQGLDSFKLVDLEGAVAYAITEEELLVGGWLVPPP